MVVLVVVVATIIQAMMAQLMPVILELAHKQTAVAELVTEILEEAVE